MFEKVNEILDFWFGKEEQNLLVFSDRWWQHSCQFDAEITRRFAEVHKLAATGKLKLWTKQPKSCLAYIILLDQFSRNMYRDSSLAFAQDKLALDACEYGREHKLDKDLHLIQRLFFYMPLEHSEEILDQKLCLTLMQQLVHEARESEPFYLQMLTQALSYAQKHYDIILNFKRFPHRNAILERESTQEELVFLNLPHNNLFL